MPSSLKSTSPEHGGSVTVETRGGPVLVSEPGPREVVPFVATAVEIVKGVQALRDKVEDAVEDGDVTAIGFAFLAELNTNPGEHIEQIGTLLSFFTDKDADWLLDKKNMALSDLLALLEGAAQVVPFERYMRLFNRTMSRFNSLGSMSTPSSDSDVDTAAPKSTDLESTGPSDSASE